VREQLAGVVSGHTGALASVAAVAVTAVPVAVHETHRPAHHPRPAQVVAQSPGGSQSSSSASRPGGGGARHAAAHGPSDSVSAVRDACASGAPLTGRFTAGALARARDDLGAQEQEYGGCSARISSALLRSG
jgi:hypothetical protein